LTLSQNILILCGDFCAWRADQASRTRRPKQLDPSCEITLFALSLAIAVPPTMALAGGAPNSGKSAMSQSGAKVAPARPPVEVKKEQHEDGKESAK
jgi:hypothetical protein